MSLHRLHWAVLESISVSYVCNTRLHDLFLFLSIFFILFHPVEDFVVSLSKGLASLSCFVLLVL